MKDADKIKELENRIAELENEVEGSAIFVSFMAPLLGMLGRAIIKDGNIDNGSQIVVLANQLKNPEKCQEIFKNAVKNKDSLMGLKDMLESEVKKLG